MKLEFRARPARKSFGTFAATRPLLVLAVLGLAPASAPAGTIESSACRIELATTWANMKEMVLRLRAAARAGAGERCAEYRHHVQVVMRARDVLARCRTGRDRDGDLAQMDGALDDVTGAIGRECPGE